MFTDLVAETYYFAEVLGYGRADLGEGLALKDASRGLGSNMFKNCTVGLIRGIESSFLRSFAGFRPSKVELLLSQRSPSSLITLGLSLTLGPPRAYMPV